MQGNGTESDPYIIEDINDLQDVNNDLSAYYELGNNIDASETENWNDGKGFLPIGDNDTEFKGNFDGKGYIISGLYINRSDSEYVGLFGVVDGTDDFGVVNVKNVGLESVYIVGDYYVGGMCGFLYFGLIRDCYVSGEINGDQEVGGFCGTIQGFIRNCYSHVDCSGRLYVGGFGGVLIETLEFCYSIGEVDFDEDDGGGLLGGFFGTDIVSCYWDVESSGMDTSDGGTGLITSEMKDSSNFTDWDFDSVWEEDTEDINDGYHILQNIDYSSDDGGDGEDDEGNSVAYNFYLEYDVGYKGQEEYLIENSIGVLDEEYLNILSVNIGDEKEFRYENEYYIGKKDREEFPFPIDIGVGYRWVKKYDGNYEIGSKEEYNSDIKYKTGYINGSTLDFKSSVGIEKQKEYLMDNYLGIRSQKIMDILSVVGIDNIENFEFGFDINLLGESKEYIFDIENVVGLEETKEYNNKEFLGVKREYNLNIDSQIGLRKGFERSIEVESGVSNESYINENIEYLLGICSEYERDLDYNIGCNRKNKYSKLIEIGIDNHWVWGYDLKYLIGVLGQIYKIRQENRIGILRKNKIDNNYLMGVVREEVIELKSKIGVKYEGERYIDYLLGCVNKDNYDINLNINILGEESIYLCTLDCLVGVRRENQYKNILILGNRDKNIFNVGYIIGNINKYLRQVSCEVGRRREIEVDNKYEMGMRIEDSYNIDSLFGVNKESRYINDFYVGVDNKWVQNYKIEYLLGIDRRVKREILYKLGSIKDYKYEINDLVGLLRENNYDNEIYILKKFSSQYDLDFNFGNKKEENYEIKLWFIYGNRYDDIDRIFINLDRGRGYKINLIKRGRVVGRKINKSYLKGRVE